MASKFNRSSAIQSLEALLLMSASTIEGSDANDWISGDGNDNSIFAGGGNDEIHSPLGNNIIDGGSGNDTLVVYEGNRADFSLSQLADSSFLLQGPGLNGSSVSNRLVNVENISFNDGAVSLGSSGVQSIPVANIVNDVSPQPTGSNAGITLNGSDAGQWISATEGDDNINAGGGNDNIHAPLGNNAIDGGSGFDTLIVYEGNRSQYSISQQNDGSYRVEGPGLNGIQQVNMLANVEQIQFNDQFVSLQSNFSDQTIQQSQQADVFVANDTPQQQLQPAAEPIQTPQQVDPVFVPPQPQISDFVAEVIRLTNNIRTQNGLGTVTFNSELQAAAVGHSNDMANLDFFSHTGLDGQEPWDRAIEAGYNYRNIGENIAAGQLTPAEVVQAWFDSASHRDNLLNPLFTEIGVGYTFLQNDTGSLNYNHYWSQVLGTEQ